LRLSSILAESPLKPVQAITSQLRLSTSLSESPLKPSQGVIAQLRLSSALGETLAAPTQALTVSQGTSGSSFAIAESMPAPSQSGNLSHTIPQQGPGAWVFYPPVYPARGKIRQSALAPSQSMKIKQGAGLELVQRSLAPSQELKAGQGRIGQIMEFSLAPSQSIIARSGIGPGARDEEELMLLMLTA
jgi:hypothetical protein